MKASAVASVVSALLATDAKPTEAAILAAIIAADKKAKDEGGLGPLEIQNKKAGDKAKDAFPEKDDKAEDEKDDEKAKDADMDDDKAKDADMDDEKAKDADLDDEGMDADPQPKESVTGGGAKAGNAGPQPAKDKKGMDAQIKIALDARDALHAARRAVESVIGVVTYDSAAEVYAAALKKLGVAVDGIDASAYPALFKLARDKQDAVTPVMASDAATVKTMSSVIKGYDRLR